MASIWQDKRTPEQKQAAAERATQRRAEWNKYHAANPVHVAVADQTRGHNRDSAN